jgi:hypothetical protein
MGGCHERKPSSSLTSNPQGRFTSLIFAMTENVFLRSRRVGKKRVRARLYTGRYSLARGEKPITVPLHTPDERVARKRLRDIVIEAQREQEGMIPPRSIRVAASTPLVELLAEYAQDLKGRG